MLDIQQFTTIATIEMYDPIVAAMNELPSPHECARVVLEKFAGVRLVPFNEHHPDVSFGVEEAVGYQKDILQLSEIIGEELYPIGMANNEHGILLISSTKEVYAISVNNFDVYSLGNLENALYTILKGERLRPVLPRRDYPQSHNIYTYLPTRTDVMWIDTPEWIKSTEAE